MAATKPRTNHQSRVNWWRTTLRHQREGNLSVIEFCRRLGVAVSTFYYWKNRVHELVPDARGQVAGASRSCHATAAANFVPLSIIEPGAGAELEIELTNACVVRFKGVIDPLVLQAAIMATGRLDGSRQGAN
jgi:hypothetical protein